MQGSTAFWALTGVSDFVETGRQLYPTHGAANHLVKTGHAGGSGTFARGSGLRTPTLPTIAVLFLVTLLSVFSTHFDSRSAHNQIRQGQGSGLLQRCASALHTGDVDGIAPRINPANNSLFVDDKRGSLGHPSLFVQHSVELTHLPVKITQQSVFDSQLLCEFLLSGTSINADPDDLGIMLLEVVDIRLISV